MSDHPDFGTFGRFQETPVDEMPPTMRHAYDFTKTLRGLVPGPHKIWLANPTLSKTIVPIGDYYQKRSTLTKAEIEIVTNLVTARWHASYASFEHEMIGEKQGKLPPEKVDRIIAGLPTAFEDPREDVVYQLAYALVQPRIVSQGLYQRAKDLLSDAGIVDVAVLIGWFTMVSATLNAFDVPSDATGLDQQANMPAGRASQEVRMAGENRGLGGRVPLLDPATLDPTQKALYDQALQTVVPFGGQLGIETRTSGDRLIGPFNSMLFSPEISKAFLALEKAEDEHTNLSKRARQVVILSAGSVWKAPYELYAHSGEARDAGLDDATIEALKKGEPSDGLRDNERIAQRFALAVVAERRVDDSLFAAAQGAFDNKGVLNMLFLVACYQMVCSLLNVFEVPVPTRSV